MSRLLAVLARQVRGVDLAGDADRLRGHSCSRQAPGGKTDNADAHSIALVGVRMDGLRTVVDDEQLELLACWWTGAAGSVKSTPGWSASFTAAAGTDPRWRHA